MAAILVEGGRVLVARRFDDAHLGGLWEFPGGKIEPGETDEAALARELREELGIEVRVGPVWGILAHRYPERSVRLRFHFVRRTAGEPRAIGCADLRWVTPPELSALPFPAADRILVDELNRAHREGRDLAEIRWPAGPELPDPAAGGAERLRPEPENERDSP